MSDEKQETIADIIKEARGVFDELLKHGYNVVSVDRMADIIDRIEAAHKLERGGGAEAAQICGEIGEMVGREASKNKSVTDCNRFGNAAHEREVEELRECLREAVEWSCGNPDDACGDCVAHGADTPCKCETWRKMLEGGHK